MGIEADEFTVTSDLYSEIKLDCQKCENGRTLSKFKYYPPEDEQNKENEENGTEEIFDEEGKRLRVIEIEHSRDTALELVGLQVWRGALLLSDLLLHMRKDLHDKQILELGAGVGLTSIAAAMYAKKVICTDIDLEDILKLIEDNVEKNLKLIKNDIKVMELDFDKDFSPELEKYIEETDIILAGDVIYFDNLTDSFVNCLDKVLDRNRYKKPKIAYVALEKRSAFTSGANINPPCFAYFMEKTKSKPWKVEYMPIVFPQYFVYDRCSKLVLLKITNI